MSIKTNVRLPDFSGLRILVIGDVIIDKYITGTIRRISPEAPVPIVEISKVENRLGGAANVALNLKMLGAQVSLLSVIGDDQDGAFLMQMMAAENGIQSHFVTIPDRKTTVKTRVMASNQHILRMDNEDTQEIAPMYEEKLIQSFYATISVSGISGVILQDYNKGALTECIIRLVIEHCNKKKISTFVDPKEKNFFAFKNCTMFKPNKKEISKALNIQNKDYEEADKKLRNRLNHKLTCITLGSEGIYMNDGKISGIHNTKPRIIADVCGAGDTVISVAALCYLAGLPASDIATIANIAGGQVCEKPGVVSIDRNALESELSEHN